MRAGRNLRHLRLATCYDGEYLDINCEALERLSHLESLSLISNHELTSSGELLAAEVRGLRSSQPSSYCVIIHS